MMSKDKQLCLEDDNIPHENCHRGVRVIDSTEARKESHDGHADYSYTGNPLLH